MKKTECMLPSWQEIQELGYQVADEMRSSGFEPDTVVALARGGVVPARIICDALVISDYIAIKVDHWGITATKSGKAKLRREVDWDLSGKKVLLVDDITDTGESMALAKDVVSSMNPSELRTATLYHIDHSEFEPDFFAKEISWKWVIFPWNMHEDLVNLVGKIVDEEKISVDEEKISVDEIAEEFESRHGVRVPAPAIRRAMEHLEAL